MPLDPRTQNLATVINEASARLDMVRHSLFVASIEADNASAHLPDGNYQAIRQAYGRARLLAAHALWAAREVEDEVVRAQCGLPPSPEGLGWYGRRQREDPLPCDCNAAQGVYPGCSDHPGRGLDLREGQPRMPSRSFDLVQPLAIRPSPK